MALDVQNAFYDIAEEVGGLTHTGCGLHQEADDKGLLLSGRVELKKMKLMLHHTLTNPYVNLFNSGGG